jgi:hypothetical protein
MAEVTIRLVVDAATGKKNVVVGYDSDSSSLPMEHEEDHKKFVERLLEATGLSPDDLGEIIVEREEAQSEKGGESSNAEEQQAPQSISEDQ